MHVVDPVASQVAHVEELPGARAGSITAALGDARQLDNDDASFDVVLFLGPLYHLTDRGDRHQALAEAHRVVVPSGQHRNPTRHPHWFTTAFFHHPDELGPELEEAGLAVLGIFGVEGLAIWLSHLEERWDDPAARDAIVESARLIEAEPSLLGLSPHLLAVTQRP